MGAREDRRGKNIMCVDNRDDEMRCERVLKESRRRARCS